MNVLMYNYQYCFNFKHNIIINFSSNKRIVVTEQRIQGGGGTLVPPFGETLIIRYICTVNTC